MATNKTTDSGNEIANLKPRNFAAPLEELINSAVNTQGFKDYQPVLLEETLSNIRGLKSRILDSVIMVSIQAEKDEDFIESHRIVTLLSEFALDMEKMERMVANRLIEGAH